LPTAPYTLSSVFRKSFEAQEAEKTAANKKGRGEGYMG
jgi:hypothetical protein